MMETKNSKQIEIAMLLDCRRTLSVIYNGNVPNKTAVEMLGGFPGYILAEVLLDTFNRVPGCFAFNESTFYGEE